MGLLIEIFVMASSLSRLLEVTNKPNLKPDCFCSGKLFGQFDSSSRFDSKDDESQVRRKIGALTQNSSDDVISEVIARPLVNILAETGNVDLTVQSFLENSELFETFNQVPL